VVDVARDARFRTAEYGFSKWQELVLTGKARRSVEELSKVRTALRSLSEDADPILRTLGATGLARVLAYVGGDHSIALTEVLTVPARVARTALLAAHDASGSDSGSPPPALAAQSPAPAARSALAPAAGRTTPLQFREEDPQDTATQLALRPLSQSDPRLAGTPERDPRYVEDAQVMHTQLIMGSPPGV